MPPFQENPTLCDDALRNGMAERDREVVYERGDQGAVHPASDRSSSRDTQRATYAGECVVCGAAFGPQDAIAFDHGEQGWKHDGC